MRVFAIAIERSRGETFFRQAHGTVLSFSRDMDSEERVGERETAHLTLIASAYYGLARGEHETHNAMHLAYPREDESRVSYMMRA